MAASAVSDAKLELVGIGSMVLDRMHRARRLLGPNEKGLLDPIGDGGPVQLCIGGVLLNQVGWAALFDIRTGLCGRQADDEAGRTLRGAMEAAGIETHLDLTASASSLAEIFIDAEGERAIYMAAGATSETTPDHIRRDHTDFIARGARLSTEVSQLPLDATLAALQVAHEQGLSTALDLDVLPSDAVAGLGDRETLEAVLAEADLLKPTVLAARELFPEAEKLEDLVAAMRARYGTETVVLTDGERGCLLCDASGTRWIAAYDIQSIVDTTGAGDAFLGGLLAGIALGLRLDDAARLGNACGAACVERVGAFPSAADALRRRALRLYDGAASTDARWEALSK
jgi:ribokinase